MKLSRSCPVPVRVSKFAAPTHLLLFFPTSCYSSCLPLLSCLFLLYLCGLGLCPNSELVCGLLDWCCFYYFVTNSLVALQEVLCAQNPEIFEGCHPIAHCQKSLSVTIDWRIPGLFVALSTLLGVLHYSAGRYADLVFWETWLLGPVSLILYASPQTLWTVLFRYAFNNSNRVPLSNPCLQGGIQSTGTVFHATWILTESAVRAILSRIKCPWQRSSQARPRSLRNRKKRHFVFRVRGQSSTD